MIPPLPCPYGIAERAVSCLIFKGEVQIHAHIRDDIIFPTGLYWRRRDELHLVVGLI